MDVKGIAAVVTGGASGLGGATSSLPPQVGARVTIFDLNTALSAAKGDRRGRPCRDGGCHR
jgi:NAD(P)-dependent dehydrogenase (short-subunit alcohol dehydrogenase family)